MKKTILAISAAIIETPVNPRIPAMIAITRKISTHWSIAKLAKLAPVTYKIKDNKNKIKKITKNILASATETIAKPVKPKIAETIAINKNNKVKPNIIISL